MTAEQVIQQGETINSALSQWSSSNMAILIPMFVGAVMIMIIVYLIMYLTSNIKNEKIKNIVTSTAFAAVIISTIVGIIISYQHENKKMAERQEAHSEWVTDYVIPYAKTQDYTDYALDSIEVVEYGSEEHRVVKYVDEEQVTRTVTMPRDNDDIQIMYDATQETGDFVRFYEIPVNLGHEFEPGEYALTVHMKKKDDAP